MGRKVTNITKICLDSAWYVVDHKYINLIHSFRLDISSDGINYYSIKSYTNKNYYTSSGGSYGDTIELNIEYFKTRYIRFEFLDSYYSNLVGFGNLRIYRKPDDKVFLDKDNYIYGCKENT